MNRSISLPEERLGRFHAEYPYDIASVTDDSPFFWHFARFQDALLGSLGGRTRQGFDPRVGQGERVLLYMLLFAAGYAAVFLLLPFVSVRKMFRGLPMKGRAFVYFGCLGVGFMLFEISLIQMLTLLLGYPTYSLAVTLLALLVSAGIGSYWSRRYLSRRNRSLLWLFVGLLLLDTFYLVGMPFAIDAMVGSTLAVRVAASMAFVAPLGICLGAFLPLGLATVTRLSENEVEYVAWSWAVNGFFGVVSSVLAAILAMTIGFRAVLVLALVAYAIGAATLWTIPYRATR